MVAPLELQLSPSCYSCLTWSADGELAIAAGEHVHVLTPQVKVPGSRVGGRLAKKSGPWATSRVAVNVFTSEEWEMGFPSKREDFSVGAEQSLSTVAGLAWSSPGLGKHRRCVLAVLTSSLLLTFYEALGRQRQWTRVGIVNHALNRYFNDMEKKDPSFSALRKRRVRAFAWCPPLKFEGENGSAVGGYETGEARWGRQLLAIANDDNDLVIVQVERRVHVHNDDGQQQQHQQQSPYEVRVLGHLPMGDDASSKFPMILGQSLFSAALESHTRIKHVSCGPWLAAEKQGQTVQRAVVAMVLGSRLRLARVEARAEAGSVDIELQPLDLDSVISDTSIQEVNFTGPLHWPYTEQSDLVLIAGVLAGRLVMQIPEPLYKGHRDKDNASFRLRTFSDSGHDISGNDEPITDIISSVNPDTGLSTVHISTLGRWAEQFTLSGDDNTIITPPSWREPAERFRLQYDLSHDLGNLSLCRTWGLAEFHGWIVAAFTLHPGDMIEYTTAAEERTTVVFVPPATTEGTVPDALIQIPGEFSPDYVHAQRARILFFTLTLADELRETDVRSAKLLYAAAACAVVLHYNDGPLLAKARAAFEKLAAIYGVDLSEELALCEPRSYDAEGQLIPPKPANLLSAAAGQIFERCEICSSLSGLRWDSAREAQCANGHLFARCSLTFLAIQRPFISGFCSLCGNEYLDKYSKGYKPPEQSVGNGDVAMTDADAALGPSEQLDSPGPSVVLDKLFDVFDICPYCGGKYLDA